MFLFSATFFPITLYPPILQAFIEVTPLYRSIHLIRGLTTGQIDAGLLVDVLYLVLLGLVGVAVASVRLRPPLLKWGGWSPGAAHSFRETSPRPPRTPRSGV